MGYDCYVTLQAHIPDTATGHAVLDLLEADENWGVFHTSEVGDDYLYCQWEGRNRDEDAVRALLEPVALRHAITFEVGYSSDYDNSLHFFVGVDANRLNAAVLLDRVIDDLHTLLKQPSPIITDLLQEPQRRGALDLLVDKLSALLVKNGGTNG